MKTLSKAIQLTSALLILALYASCTEEETFAEPTQAKQEFIEFQLIGLKTDIEKQVVLTCGPVYLDTIIKGNFKYRVPVTQKIMSSYIRIRSIQPVLDNIYIFGRHKVGFSPGCEYTNAEFQEIFYY